MKNNDASVQQQIQALRETYTGQLPGKIDSIENRWNTLIDEEWNPAIASELQRMTHSLAGSGGTFGYPKLGSIARSMEQLFKVWAQEQRIPDEAQRTRIISLLAKLQQAASVSPAMNMDDTGVAVVEQQRAANEERPLVYLIEDDQAIADELVLQLDHFGYRIRTFSSADGVEQAVAGHCPSAFIVDINLPEGDMAGIELMRGLQQRHGPDLPVIFISSHNDFTARLESVRAGGEAYFVKPLEIAPLIDRLDTLTRSDVPLPYRILTIDDDDALAAHYAILLRQAGMEVSTVSRADEVMETLADFKPELILMDIYMPDCSGLEIAKLIRQHEAYLGIPIVFLSSETDTEKQFTAMRMGGDDFLTKPIRDSHLVSSIMVRAERARILSALMVQDSLTGLYKHTTIKEQLAQEFSRAQRVNSDISFAMIDIDKFKSVNDKYGHLMGDRVIKSLARLLKQRLRKSDKIGRYGGEEFAVVMPDCDPQLAEKVLNEIRKDFSELHYQHDGVDFSATFSAGIAGLSDSCTPEEINAAADEALYEAKQQGRNRIIVDEKSGGARRR